MKYIISQAALDAVADEFDLNVRVNYSGRGMYGATCVGVEGNFGDAFKLLIGLTRGDEDDENGPPLTLDEAADLASGTSTDSMGLDKIFYWRNLEAENELEV